MATKNDLRLVALTAIIMKTYERIVLKHLSPENLVDILQFAFISDRNVDDANLTMLNNIHEHVDKPRTVVIHRFQ